MQGNQTRPKALFRHNHHLRVYGNGMYFHTDLIYYQTNILDIRTEPYNKENKTLKRKIILEGFQEKKKLINKLFPLRHPPVLNHPTVIVQIYIIKK